MFNEHTPIILYIEDNQDNRKLVQKVLTAAGFEIHAVPDGPSGLSFVDDKTPDLVLMDIGMPHMDGYEATKLLRRKQGMADIPIIALTAHAMKGDEEKSLDAGCNGYIRKPINIDRFPSEVLFFLNRARTPAKSKFNLEVGGS
ncbi:MAG: response regulator [Ardenticatenaceae bacterium]|nr:response regulator [Ardenticatenaceae bacterium]